MLSIGNCIKKRPGFTVIKQRPCSFPDTVRDWRTKQTEDTTDTVRDWRTKQTDDTTLTIPLTLTTIALIAVISGFNTETRLNGHFPLY